MTKEAHSADLAPSLTPLEQFDSNGRKIRETSVLTQDMFQIKSGSNSSRQSRRLAKVTIVLLILLGITAGLVNGMIVLLSSLISQAQADIATSDKYMHLSFLYFIISTVTFTTLSAALCKFFARSAAGSGLPEFKSLLASELKKNQYFKHVSTTILVVKAIGLILSVGAGLSVGSEGPLVHTAACIAYTLMKSNAEFEELLDSPALAKQVFAASAAVGISSSFNAPVGGLLFSVEVTSTFYLISNYWKSFLAAAFGSLACYLFLFNENGSSAKGPLIVLPMTGLPRHQFEKWEMIIFALMSVALGYLSVAYLALNQKYVAFIKPYNRDYPLVTAAVVACISAILIYLTGAFSDKSVGVLQLVLDCVNSGEVNEMARFGTIHPVGGLILSLIIRTFLTMIATNIAVPAGIFMPVFLIGAIFGRLVGQIMHLMVSGGPHTVYPAVYALVGATAFSAGITQTISVAVVAVELTGDLRLLLPTLLAAVFAAGISKSRCFSMYDYGMLNKGLESFQLLLMDFGGQQSIREIMSPNVSLIVAEGLTLQTVVNTLATSQMKGDQITYPLISSSGEMRLIGSIQRMELFMYVYEVFEKHDSVPLLRQILEKDCDEADDLREKAKLRNESRQKRYKMIQEAKRKARESANRISTFASRTVENASNSAVKKLRKQRKIDTKYDPLTPNTKSYGDVYSPLSTLQTITSDDEGDYDQNNEPLTPEKQTHKPAEWKQEEKEQKEQDNETSEHTEREISSGQKSTFSFLDTFIGGGIESKPNTYKTPQRQTHKKGAKSAVQESKQQQQQQQQALPRVLESGEIDLEANTTSSGVITDRIEPSQSSSTAVAAQSTEQQQAPQQQSQTTRMRSLTNATDSSFFTAKSFAKVEEDRKSVINLEPHKAKIETTLIYLNEKAVIAGKFLARKGKELIQVARENMNENNMAEKRVNTAAATVALSYMLRDLLSHPLMTDALRETLTVPLEIDHTLETIPVNFSPFCISLKTPMEQVYVLFEMVRMTCIFVVEGDGQFIGMIGRQSILDSLRKKDQ